MSTSLLPQPTPQIIAPQPPRLLDQVAQAARQRGASGTDDDTASVLATGLHPVPRQAASARTGRGWGPHYRWPLVAAALLLALMPLGYFFGGTIIRIVTNQGELVVEVDDPNVQIKVVQNGVIVQDKTAQRQFTLTAGKGQIEVFEKDGIKLATREFTLARGSKTTVKVTLQELADARTPKLDPKSDPAKSEPRPSVSGDPDRRAAEYVLSVGGEILMPDNDHWVRPATLPREPFRFRGAYLVNNSKVTDEGLANFKDCKDVEYLHLGGTQVTDKGLVYLQDCKRLKSLTLWGDGVTDAGLAHFQDCKNLTQLSLSAT